MDFPVNEFLNTGLEITAALVTASVSKDIDAQFFNEYEAQIIAEIGYEGSNPFVICKTSDVSGAGIVNQTSTLTIDSVAYTIIENQPDGTGLTTLVLSRNV